MSLLPRMFWDDEYWTTMEKDKLYPAKGDMDLEHVRSTMNFIRRNVPRYRTQLIEKMSREKYPKEKIDQVKSFTDDMFFKYLIEPSLLYQNLKIGLTVAKPRPLLCAVVSSYLYSKGGVLGR